ncbi:unnamed protein product [Gordionus sp. m RMFG-2023]
MISYLSYDELKMDSELDVFVGASKWLNYDFKVRQKFCLSILKCVRYTLIEPGNLFIHVYSQSHLFQNKQCMDLLFKSMVYHALEGKNSDEIGSKLDNISKTSNYSFLKTLQPRDRERTPKLFIPDMGINSNIVSYSSFYSNQCKQKLPLFDNFPNTFINNSFQNVDGAINLWCQSFSKLSTLNLIESKVKLASYSDPVFKADIKIQDQFLNIQNNDSIAIHISPNDIDYKSQIKY